MLRLLNIIGYALVGLTWAALGVLGLGIMLFMILPFGWWLIPVVAVVVVRAVILSRRRRATMVVTYLEQAIALNLPLGRFLEAAERSETLMMGLRLGRLRWRLEAGETIATALGQTVPELSERNRSIIDAAERLGRLPQILHYVDSRDRRRYRSDQAGAPIIWGYLFGLAPMMLIVLMGTMLFIVPQFEMIFDDFDTVLPAATVSLIDFSKWLGGRLYPNQILPGLLYIFYLVSCVLVAWLLTWLTPDGRKLAGRIAWRFPISHGVVRDRALADVCRLAAESARAGIPLPAALAEAAQLEVNPVIRRRVSDWARHCAQGASPAEGARRAKLPALMAGLLATGENDAQITPALEFLARYYAGKFSRVCQVLRQASKPAVVLAFALPMGWLVYALFVPMVALLDHVNAGTGYF